MKRTIVLDWDGTLVDARSRSLSVFQTILTGRGIRVSADEASILFEGTVGSALDHFGISGLAARSALNDYRTTYLASSSTQVRQFSSMSHALRYWRGRGVGLAIVTSKVADLVRADDSQGRFLSMIDVVVGDGMCKPKPSGEGIALALKLTGAIAQASVMVGDSANDIVAGRSAGCHVVGATYGFFAGDVTAAGPDRVADTPRSAFRHVSDLLELDS